MYFDFEDRRPETPRVPTALSVREGILLSLVFHLSLVIVLLLNPDVLSTDQSAEEAARLAQQINAPPLRFVEAMPLRDVPRPPIRPADESDIDRRSASRERAPVPDNNKPLMRGNTPEMIEGGAVSPAAGAPPAASDSTPLPLDDAALRREAEAAAVASQTASRSLADSLRNPLQYLRNERFDNSQGGDTEQSADVQFDTMGTDFGQWWPRVKYQVQRNWLIPIAARTSKGRVVIRFTVHRNGTITDLMVLEPDVIPALTAAALNALKLSNPTVALPAAYPADRMPITVTFYYNYSRRDFP